jgi:hypothetical protein
MSIAVREVYSKSEGKIYQDKIEACRYIIECKHYDLFQIYITIKV